MQRWSCVFVYTTVMVFEIVGTRPSATTGMSLSPKVVLKITCMSSAPCKMPNVMVTPTGDMALRISCPCSKLAGARSHMADCSQWCAAESSVRAMELVMMPMAQCGPGPTEMVGAPEQTPVQIRCTEGFFASIMLSLAEWWMMCMVGPVPKTGTSDPST